MNVPFHAAPTARSQPTTESRIYHAVGIGWLVYWLTNSYVWMADVVPILNFYVVTTTFLLYFTVARAQQVIQFVLRPGIWLWAITALIPVLLYLTASNASGYAYLGARDRILFFALVAGSGLVMADRDGPWMLRRAAGIALAIAVVVNFGEFFVHNPYNRTEGTRSAGFYGDPNICGAAIGTLLLLYQPVTKQSRRSLLITGIAFMAIVATMSRSGMVFAVGLVGVYLFLPRGPGTLPMSSRILIGAGALGMLILGSVVMLSVVDLSAHETWRIRSLLTLDLSDESTTGRLDMASFAYRRFEEYFWTGRGPGSTQEYAVYAHNTYLTIGYDYGIFGILLYLAFIGFGFVKYFKYGWARSATYVLMAFQVVYYSNFAHDVHTNAVFAVMFASFLTNASLEPAAMRAAPSRSVPVGLTPHGQSARTA